MFSIMQLTGLFPKKSSNFAFCGLSPLSLCSYVGCLLPPCHGWKPRKLASGDPWDAEGLVKITQVCGLTWMELYGRAWCCSWSCGAQSWLLQPAFQRDLHSQHPSLPVWAWLGSGTQFLKSSALSVASRSIGTSVKNQDMDI